MVKPEFEIKKGTIDDAEIICNFINQLAEYEKLTHEVTTTPDELAKTLFSENTHVHTIIGYYNKTKDNII